MVRELLLLGPVLGGALLVAGCGPSFDRSEAATSPGVDRAAARIGPDDGAKVALHPDPERLGHEIRAQAVRGPTLVPINTPPPPG